MKDVDLTDTHTVTLVDALASGDQLAMTATDVQSKAVIAHYMHSGSTAVMPAASEVLAIQAAIAASSFTITNTDDSTGSGTGQITWSFSAADNKFAFLGQGETLTLTYAVQVADSQGSITTQPVTITITGTNDAPVISVGEGNLSLIHI